MYIYIHYKLVLFWHALPCICTFVARRKRWKQCNGINCSRLFRCWSFRSFCMQIELKFVECMRGACLCMYVCVCVYICVYRTEYIDGNACSILSILGYIRKQKTNRKNFSYDVVHKIGFINNVILYGRCVFTLLSILIFTRRKKETSLYTSIYIPYNGLINWISRRRKRKQWKIGYRPIFNMSLNFGDCPSLVWCIFYVCIYICIYRATA